MMELRGVATSWLGWIAESDLVVGGKLGNRWYHLAWRTGGLALSARVHTLVLTGWNTSPCLPYGVALNEIQAIPEGGSQIFRRGFLMALVADLG
jgi:hypothetical protein